jgi:RHS repeat-associated protein
MKTSIIERILRRVKQTSLPALPARSCVAGLLLIALTWPLVLPGSVRAERFVRHSQPVAPVSGPNTQAAETFTVYGPQRFTRNNGAPLNVVQSFSIPADAVAPFNIFVDNGAPSGSNRVSTATIKLNGNTLYKSNDFNQNVPSLTQAVTLAATNTLEVKLGSAVGSYLTISFTGTRIANQPTLDSVTPARTTQGQTLNVTLRGTNTHWTTGQTRAALGGEVAIGGAGYGEPGPVTVVDSTTIIASIVVSPTAALEPRTARVVTPLAGGGAEESVSLAAGFTVDAATSPGGNSANVSTIAGAAGSSGFADGNGIQARFQNMNGVAIGPDDAIYVADTGNHRIRVVRQTGSVGATTWTVSTLAGTGAAGFADGPTGAAVFNKPQGVAVDQNGVVYVADTENNRIRKIASDGTVSTLAGDGTPGLQNGAGSQARFNSPQGVAADSQGNVYVADTGNSAVRMISGGGTVTTMAGDGTIGANDSPGARFDGLVGIAVEGQNVYVYLADTGNHRIRRLDVAGTVITVAGAERGFKDGSASQARFAEPSGIAIDGAGKILIADGVNSLIRVVDPELAANGSNQAVTTLAGTGIRGLTDGAGDLAKFFTPRGLAVSNSSAIIVADTGNHVLRRILLPPIIHAITPPSARLGDTVAINGERFDGRGPEHNVVRFTRAGGGQTFGSVTQATRVALTVVVPADAASGPVTVQTEGGTATSASDFVINQFPAPVITDFNPKRGPVGTQVTLTGTNLKVNANDPAVTFAGSGGRLPALVNSASATAVHVTVPNAAITGTIQLTHVGGTASTASAFTVDTEQDFQLTVAPSTTTAVQGGSGTYVVYVTSPQSTFSQLASLTATGLPAGITATFDPAQITAGASSTLILKLNGTIASTGYPFTIHAVAGIGGQNVEHTAGATLNVMSGGQTTLSGRVLSTDREPIIGATASLDGHTAMTDAAGAFLLSGVTAGTSRPLMIDGRTASSPNKTYPVIIEPANIVAGQANVNPYTFYLPPIDTQYEVEVVPGQITNATNPRIPGLQMTIPAGANLRNRDGSPVARISITPLAIDRTPAPLPANIRTGLVYTSQPGGAISDVPLPVIYPNLLGVNPGTRVELYAFNHDTVQWYIYGYGRVSADGRTIAPEIDPSTGKQYGLRDFSWHMPNAGSGGDGGGGGKGCDSCPCSRTGDPVDLSTGIKFETVTDVSFGGARGDLTLRREYSSDNSAQAILGRFGRGWKDSYDIRLTGNWVVGGAGRLVMPDEQTGRLFSYVRTDADGTLVFGTSATVGQLGDVVRKTTSGIVDYRRASGDVMRFDSGGRLISMIDRNGNTTTLSYTGSNLTQITDPVGRALTLGYDSSSRINVVTDPLGRSWHYTYDPSIAFGILSTVTDPLGGVTRYAYTNLRLSSITDPRGNFVKRLTYDSSGRVISQQFADGGVERYDYALSGGIVTETTVTDPLNRKLTKRFNASGYVIGTSDALGQSSKIERGLNNNLSGSTVGPCGCAEVTRQFDDRGNPTTITDRLGQTETYEYDPVFNNLLKTTDNLGRVTTYSYDAHGNLTSVTNALNQTNSFTYDAFGSLLSSTDALGHAVTLEYDNRGNVIGNFDALGNHTTMEYDAVGRRTAVTDPLGRRTSLIYDALDRVITKTDPSNAVTTYGYDENGNQIGVTDALNHVSKTTYDVKNLAVSQTDPLGHVSRVRYDLDDEPTVFTSPSGRTTSYAYDQRGHKTTMVDSLGNVVSYSYDNRGNLVAVTDQRGNKTTLILDELFRPAKVRDPVGNVASITYDLSGNLKAMVDRLGNNVAFDYDALNRPSRVSYADATVDYTYDPAGQVTRLDDSQSGSIAWTYDASNRQLSETTQAGIVSYGYNAANQRTSMTAANRSAVNYSYDSSGRLQTIAQGAEVFTYDYDALSRVVGLQRPNGITSSYTYNAENRLVGVKHGNTPVIEDLHYTYTVDDALESITSLASGQRLPSQKTSSAADSGNRIAQVGSSNFTFDAKGRTTARTTSEGATNYQWDARGRLVGVRLPDGRTVSYAYDGLGRRTNRTLGLESTNFLYDGNEVVSDTNSTGATIDYLNGPGTDQKLRQASAATGNLYFLRDHQESSSALTDASGNVVERLSFDPFGDNPANSLTRYGYAGRERDQATGLIYNRARWYDPQQGRFISEDPIGLQGGLNLYSYVENDPVNHSDPLGLQGRAGPTGKGNYHPPFKVRCNPSQDCATLARNMAEIARAIASAHLLDQELGFPRHQPPYSTDIPDWQNAFARCKRIYDSKCKDCGPPPTPVPVPVPNPAADAARRAANDRAIQRSIDESYAESRRLRNVALGGAAVGVIVLAIVIGTGGAAAPLVLAIP